ncbi:MAG: response regulator [Candidatus Dactylopiibacterium sp.]|nr:response regulator [Candidatus Dactylopiibacterium sp.]
MPPNAPVAPEPPAAGLEALREQLAALAQQAGGELEDPERAPLALVRQLATMLTHQMHEKERLVLALDTRQEGLWEWDLRQGTAYLSEQWWRGLGYMGEAQGDLRADWLELIHPDDLAGVQARLDAHLEGRSESFEAEYRLRGGDGDWRWVASRGKVVSRNREGRALRMVGLHRNVTERKFFELEMLRAKEAAESASRAKGDFLANMSHEIRTPMNGIIGMTELALDTRLDTEQRGYLQTVRNSAESLLAIINDILDFSKIEAGKLALENIEFSLPAVLSDTFKALALRGHQKGLELVFGFAPDVPQVLRGDPNRLRQVLMNLLGNAIKFTERGEIEVRVHALQRNGTRCRLQFDVRDTGIGIPADKQAEIFDAFSQADSSTTRRYGGTGLGLAICRRLVELMRGRLWLSSEMGRGSVFSFTTEAEVMRERVKADVPDPIARGMRVLVVEDSPAAAREIAMSLRQRGFKVAVARSGEAARAELERAGRRYEPFDVMFVDAAMPEPGGFALPEHFHGEGASCERIIMLLRSDSQRNDAERCRLLGIRANVVKPASAGDILDAIRLVLVPEHAEAEIRLEEFRIDESLLTQTGASAPQRRRRVLLVEDNLVNQTVATRLLQRGGYEVQCVENGQEAVDSFELDRYDLILMDVQMPVLGGIEATKAIRAREARRSWAMSGRWEVTPIIAMTAHVMQGDRERCLEAGMDDYVSKPVQPAELFAAIERVTRRLEGSDDEGPADLLGDSFAPGEDAPLIDLTQARALMEDDGDGVRALIAIFLDDFARGRQKIEHALQAKDYHALAAAVHAIKSSVAVFGARQAAALAQQIESGARKRLPESFASGPELLDLLDRVAALLAREQGQAPLA